MSDTPENLKGGPRLKETARQHVANAATTGHLALCSEPNTSNSIECQKDTKPKSTLLERARGHEARFHAAMEPVFQMMVELGISEIRAKRTKNNFSVEMKA